MDRLVKVALFWFIGTAAWSSAAVAVETATKDIHISNFNELGAILLEEREEIKTQVMLHDGTSAFSNCNNATNSVREKLISHINTDFLYYDYRIGCEANGLFGVRFTFELMVEPKTPADQAYADHWIARHNHIEIGGKKARFIKAASVNSKVTLMSGMVPAVGRGPLRVVHQNDATKEFSNYGESQVFVDKVAAEVQRVEIEGVFDAAGLIFGTDGPSEYPSILPRVNYVRATALPVFNWENGASRKSWYYKYFDHDCRETDNGMCL